MTRVSVELAQVSGLFARCGPIFACAPSRIRNLIENIISDDLGAMPGDF